MGSFDAGYGSSHMARIVGQKKARGDYTNKIKTKKEKKNQSSHFVRILEQIETCGSPPYQTKKEKQSLHTLTAK